MSLFNITQCMCSPEKCGKNKNPEKTTQHILHKYFITIFFLINGVQCQSIQAKLSIQTAQTHTFM